MAANSPRRALGAWTTTIFMKKRLLFHILLQYTQKEARGYRSQDLCSQGLRSFASS